MAKSWILFYDSGIGGLKTLNETMRYLSGVDFLYFADDKNCPYGNKSKEEILKLVKENIRSLLNRFNIKMIVFACNTVTACCVNEFRKQINIPIVGTEPAIALAEKESKTKEVLVIATKATINQEKLKKLINKMELKVHVLGLENLAKDIEESFVFGKDLNLNDYITQINNILKVNKGIDRIVLGCTHYSYIKKMLEEKLDRKCLDGNQGVARRVKTLFEDVKREEERENNVEVVLSSSSELRKCQYFKVLKALKSQEN
ncbi:MAG: glutamate racemase [Clostridia bacterium]|nr:glutamate racemase [Clostridia bacterium]